MESFQSVFKEDQRTGVIQKKNVLVEDEKPTKMSKKQEGETIK